MECELYWDLISRGIETLGGLVGWARAFECKLEIPCECDVVVAMSDLDRVSGMPCVWPIEGSGFSNKRVWIGGIPHVSLELLQKVRSPYTDQVLQCIMDALRRRAGGVRLLQAE